MLRLENENGFSLRIFIFPDVREPHWTLSRAVSLRPLSEKAKELFAQNVSPLKPISPTFYE
jgi:hypothetical protein